MEVRVTCIAAVVLLVSSLVNISNCDYFSAIVELEKVLHVEHNVAHDLRDYINKEQQRLDNLKRVADDFEQHSAHALSDTEKHLSNPINAYLLIKRFTSDWNHIFETQIRSNATEEFLDKLAGMTTTFPTYEDLQGAAEALLRLQDTYALPASTMANGELQGIKESTHMTAEDCFKLGSIAYTSSDYYHTIMWMKEAMNILDREPMKTVNRADLLDYLSYSFYMQGNVRRALNLTRDWLAIEPDHIRAQGNLHFYEQLILEEEAKSRNLQREREVEDLEKNPRPLDAYKMSADFQNYEALCRGEKTHEIKDQHKLTCTYRKHHPFLFIRPIKEEMVSFEPKMYMFHGVMTNKQIERIKELGRPRLGRSVVYHTSNSATTTAQNYRISKSGWLKDCDDEAVARFSHLAGILSNLTLDTVEDLQVLNYGIGGHYEPHYDFATNRELNTFEKAVGNRIATFICYLSDVTAGGATVFPGIGVSYWPKKGSCALWYNLMKSGEGDMRTRHAACPVLSGFKWACNKWFHERGQEFIRPCTQSSRE